MADQEIRSVLVPLSGLEILLPNANVAEIIAYSSPEPLPESSHWLLGNLLWHGWKVPVISLAMMAGAAQYEGRTEARICVTKSLIGYDRMPYLGLLSQGFPRLVTVTHDNFTEVANTELDAAFAGRAIIGDREVILPDLDAIATRVADEVFPARNTL